MDRKIKDWLVRLGVYISSAFTVLILAVIIGFIVINGVKGIDLHFLISDYEDKTTYVTADLLTDTSYTEEGYIGALGITLEKNEEGQYYIKDMIKQSPVKEAVDGTGAVYRLKKGDVITKIGDYDLEQNKDADMKEIAEVFNNIPGADVKLKVVRVGGGILPMIITTVYMIFLSLIVAAPIGILSAVYLNEYAKPGKIIKVIRFAIENLAGIPSIIYGLFGSIFFVQICRFQYSILAGALTISIMLLPVIISTTEEALKTIPMTYRESSLGLGATKLQTTLKIVLPNAIPGILVAVILSIGRVVGESAALLLTAGTVAKVPTALFGNGASGATLTIKAYTLMKEENDIQTACAIGVILLILVILINISSKVIGKKLMAKRNA
jgi:phosphate transport system permease protein